MQVFLLLFVIMTIINGLFSLEDFSETWSNYKKDYNRTYRTNGEESKRMAVFKENLKKVNLHNDQYQKGYSTFTMGINKYSDLTKKEINKILNGYKGVQNHMENMNINLRILDVETSISLDWRELEVVTPVGDQGLCASCWAFSATGALEAQWLKKTGNLPTVSEQNLIDCSTTYGNDGCKGGSMTNSFQYIYENNGINLDASYPYEAIDNICRYNLNSPKITCNSFVSIETGNEDMLKQAVNLVGPISAALDASLATFQGYSSGVFFDINCNPQYLNHAVLIVGYGTDENNQDYWIIRNSWGTGWGEQGYMRLARNKGNMCGIATAASYPIV